MMRKVALVLGANPAWQKTLTFASFKYGEVNRAKQIEAFASGKGINFCRAAKIANQLDTVLLQFCGGENGAYINQALSEEHLTFHSIATHTPTRCCITCLDESNGMMTELIEPSFAVSEAEVTQYKHFIDTYMVQSDALCVCGTLPTGTNTELYEYAILKAVEFKRVILIDSFKGIAQLLGQAQNAILKINREELQLLTQESDLLEALRRLCHQYPLRGIGITDGPHQAFWTDGKKIYTYTLSKLPYIVSPLGSGDTTSAIFMSNYLNGIADFEAFALALAAAQANCLNTFCGNFDPAAAQKFREQMKISSNDLNNIS